MELGDLTERERRIAWYVTRGLSTREIAREMSTNERLIEFLVRRLFEKVGAKDRASFALAWIALQMSPRSEEML
jgi:DNA-binding CsgD family transcriptional regulator